VLLYEIRFTNATVIDDTIRFVSQKSKENIKPSGNSNKDEKESRESDYDEDEDQGEEKA
jgi:hypothetical protein